MKISCSSMATIAMSQPYRHQQSHPYNKLNRNITKASTPSHSEEKKKKELRVCTNRTCRRQGSLGILQVLIGIAPPHVSVTSCGCLGSCGSGPNVVFLPAGDIFKHRGTPSKAASLMFFLSSSDASLPGDFSVEDECNKCLEALALRRRAEDEMGRADFSSAEALLSQALDLEPFGGVHLILKDRCAARLAMGDLPKAFEDAKAALALAPNYSAAYLCQGDILVAMDQIDAARESYTIALELDPSIRRSKSFKARLEKLL